MVFSFRCLYDAIKELLRNARFDGRQYTQAEVVVNAAGDRVYSAFNTGSVYEAAQLHCGPNCSPVPIFLSSDGTVIGKSMAGHPIICECPTQPPKSAVHMHDSECPLIYELYLCISVNI